MDDLLLRDVSQITGTSFFGFEFANCFGIRNSLQLCRSDERTLTFSLRYLILAIEFLPSHYRLIVSARRGASCQIEREGLIHASYTLSANDGGAIAGNICGD